MNNCNGICQTRDGREICTLVQCAAGTSVHLAFKLTFTIMDSLTDNIRKRSPLDDVR